MLTYMEIHLYYTLPMVWLLLTVLKPFHSSQDQVKYIFLIGMAFITASLWDNYIVYHRAWWYCPKCVTAVIGYVPLEEYMFFIIMTMITVPFTNLIMRWQLPTFYLKPTSSSFQSICTRYLPIIGFLVIAKKAWNVAIPNTPLFYGGCILWYVCPVLALLWFGAGEYICRRWKSVMISITIPTLYLCWVDKIAIRAGTWHISEKTSTQIMVVAHLPVEEFLFFFLINVVLVFATCAIDRAYAVLHLYKSNDSRQQQNNTFFISPIFSFLRTMKDLAWAFCQSDQDLNALPLEDLATTWNILKHGSASFYTASMVFPNQVRQDLGILYGFCRATDDLADNENISITQRQQQLHMVRQFVHDLFLQKSNCSQDIDWACYQQVLPSECLASFRSFVRLRHVLQPEAIHELLDGYVWDLERRPIQHEQDLKTYSACVASSVGEMCTRIILSYRYSDKPMEPFIMHDTIEKAREMGLVLQYTNIARDIVTDSQQLGRCYIPLTWLKNNELELIKTRQARRLGDTRLKEWALKLIQEAELCQVRASRGILNLPKNCQGGVRAACAVYCGIGQALKLADGYPTRAHVKGFCRALIALSSVYDLPSPSPSSNKLPHLATNKYRKGKVRSFIIESL
ncbi:Lycopene beta-cyclase [Cunninghamella echinulata]|nr:Lycopene beta-cyclase [Cunninghamella echinulata]